MSNLMLDSSGSEDEFPDIADIVRRHKSKPTMTPAPKLLAVSHHDNKENMSSPKPQLKISSMSPQKVQATPLRRRKLGLAQSQAVDGSLFQPWTGKKGETEQREASRLRKPSRALLRERSIESFRSSSIDTSREIQQPRSRARLAVDSDEGGDEPVSRRRARSMRPLRLRELISRPASPEEEESADSQLQREAREASSFDKPSTVPDDSIEKAAGEGYDFHSSDESDFDAYMSDSELFRTPPKRRPGTRRLMPLQTAASVGPKKATRIISGGIALKDGLPSPRRKDKVSSNAPKVSLATKGGSLADAFEKLKIFNDFSDSESDTRQGQKNSTTTMDPTTPSKTNKTIPASPHKTPRIPLSPWKPEHKEFWDPEVNFAWIDKHSPAKQQAAAAAAAPALKFDLSAPSAPTLSPEKKRENSKKPDTTTAASPTKKQQREAKKAFDEIKDDMARTFLAQLDERVTEGKLSQLTEATGGLRTVWSNTLQTTAGRAHWKCKTVTRTTQHKDGTESTLREAQHEAHIELAAKVLTNEADLLNTVAHEFCHLAVFMLHHNPHDKTARKPAAHGAEFKAWGKRCSEAFAHRGIEVTTRHSYEIDYKFSWRCADCLTEVHRHSRSVDPRRHRCGRCRGGLVQVKPVPRGGGAGATPAGPSSSSSSSPANANDDGGGNGVASGEKPKKRQPSAWQEFLAREMKELSVSHKGLSLEKKMEIVSAKWKIVRDTNKGKEKKKEDANSSSSSSIIIKEEQEEENIAEGVKALGIEDITETTMATADGEDDDDDIVVLSASG